MQNFDLYYVYVSPFTKFIVLLHFLFASHGFHIFSYVFLVALLLSRQ